MGNGLLPGSIHSRNYVTRFYEGHTFERALRFSRMFRNTPLHGRIHFSGVIARPTRAACQPFVRG